MEEKKINLPDQQNLVNKNKMKIAILTALVVIVVALIFFVIFVIKNDLDVKLELLNPDTIKQDIQKDEDDVVKKVIPTRNGKMWLSTVDKEIKVDDEIEVDILMDTQESNIVLAMAIIEFDDQKLEFIGRDNMADIEDSVLNMGVFNLLEGNMVEIVRGTPGDTDYLDTDDGFNGSEGILGTLKFRVLTSGTTEISFGRICREADICDVSSMVLDDGNGTVMKTEFENLNLEIK